MDDRELKEHFKNLPSIPNAPSQEYQQILSRYHRETKKKHSFIKPAIFMGSLITATLITLMVLQPSTSPNSTVQVEIIYANSPLESIDLEEEVVINDYIELANLVGEL